MTTEYTVDSVLLVIQQGATFEVDFQYKDADDAEIDLTGYSVYFVVKDEFEGTLLLEYTDSDSQVAVSTSHVIITIPYSETSAITWKNGKFQLYVTHPSDGTRIRLAEGNIDVDLSL